MRGLGLAEVRCGRGLAWRGRSVDLRGWTGGWPTRGLGLAKVQPGRRVDLRCRNAGHALAWSILCAGTSTEHAAGSWPDSLVPAMQLARSRRDLVRSRCDLVRSRRDLARLATWRD